MFIRMEENMKNKKRLPALALAACMTASLAGCGSSASSTSTAESTSTDTASASTTEAAANELDWLNTDGGLPIVKDGNEKTLKIYVENTAEYGAPEDSWISMVIIVGFRWGRYT